MVVEAVKKDVEANSLVHIMRFVGSPCPCKSMYLAHNNKFDFDANNKIISNINPSSADMSAYFSSVVYLGMRRVCLCAPK